MTAVKPEINPDGLYQAKQTAELLHIHRSTLYRYAEQGILPAHGIRRNGRQVWKGRDIIRAWYIQQ